jgi:DNA anti-recombination protein RmuC
VIRNGEIFEMMTKLKVFPVSPNTLSISLQAVAMGQEYYEMAKGVEKTIEEVKKARKHFEHFERRFDDVGKGLRKAQEAFDTAHTHLGRYETTIYRLIGEEGEKSPLIESLEASTEDGALLTAGRPALPRQTSFLPSGSPHGDADK